MLNNMHEAINSGQEAEVWPVCIPEAHREVLKGKHGLKNKMLAYKSKFVDLNQEQRDQVAMAMDYQNRISDLLAGSCNCSCLNELPVDIQEEVKNLFIYCFGLLSDLGIRDLRYEAIYNDIPDKICPFCGCEFFDAPEGPREDLDHYIAKTIYPFAAANIENLVPMGMKCNQRYKKTADILKKEDGSRRKVSNPYNGTPIKINLNGSTPFAGDDDKLPLWQIDFEPECEEAETWDDVFNIRDRYQRDVLNIYFNRWLDQCFKWCEATSSEINTRDDLLSIIGNYAENMEYMGMGDRAFLKTAVFKMLEKHLSEGNERLFNLISDLLGADIEQEV